MKDLRGKLVLVTGGGSGIGRIMTRLLLERGARVVIWDVSRANLDATQAALAGRGELHAYRVDVSSAEEIAARAAEVTAAHGTVDVLINNAGVVVGKYFHEHTTADITRTIDVNATAPLLVAAEFLPGMLSQNAGHVCNVASSGGLLGNPRMSVYAASKWSLIGWSESLRLEMKQLDKNIGVTTVMPYYINTGMFDGVKSRLPILDPEAASRTIVRAIEANRRMVTMPGYVYRLTRIGQALMSVDAFDWFAGKVMGVYKTMEGWTGRGAEGSR